MAQLLLATASAAIGFSIGGPTGAAIGWSLGSMAGSLLFAPDQRFEQPLAGDLLPTAASYGVALPLRYGTLKGGVVVIWHSAQFRAIKHESTSGGSIGPSFTQVSYTYDIDVAVLVNDRPSKGVLRVWLDGKVVYDIRTAAGQVASLDWCDALTFYDGSESQLPDPLIEADKGVGATPAYRGVSYLVIQGLKCGAAPRLPNIEVELVADGTVAGLRRIHQGEGILRAASAGGTTSPNSTVVHAAHGVASITAGGNGGYAYSIGGGATSLGSGETAPDLWPASAPEHGLSDASQGERFNLALLQWAPYSLEVAVSEQAVERPGFAAWAFRGNRGIGGMTETYPSLRLVLHVAGGASPQVDPADNSLQAIGNISLGGAQPTSAAGCADRRYMMFFTATRWAIYTSEAPPRLVREGTVDTTRPLCYGIGPATWDGITRESWSDCAMLESDLTHLWWVSGTNTPSNALQATVYEIGSDDVLRVKESGSWPVSSGEFARALWADQGICWAVTASVPPGLKDDISILSRLPGVTDGTTYLAAVERDLYGRTGNDASADLDLTAHEATEVLGYEFLGPAPIRQAFEDFRTAYFFDVVETGGKLKAVARGQSVALAIPADDLGAALAGNEAPPLVAAERAHESEIPRQVVLRYISADADYRAGAQESPRATTGSFEVDDLTLPLVLTDDAAKACTDVLLRERWRGRTPRTLVTTRKYLRLDPADVIDATDEAGITYRLRLTEQRVDGGIVTLTGIDEGGASYASSALGGSIPAPGGALATVVPTRFEVLDCVALDPSQNDYSALLAACGFSAGWTAAMFYKSPDARNWTASERVSAASTIGAAQTALPAWTGGNVADTSSTLDVQLMPGQTLANVTDDGLFELDNLAALYSSVGWEIIGFRYATALGGDRYRLSNFLRGLFGSDFASGAHAAGDAFVRLDRAKLALARQASADVGQRLYFAALSSGQSLAGATPKAVRFDAVSVKPLAPVFLAAAAVPGTTGDVLLRWTRRARIDAQWRDLVDVPLDEPTEQYQVEVLDPATGATVRTVTVTGAASWTYGAALQVADFGGYAPLASCRFRVRQMSDRAGLGWPAEATVAVGAGSGLSYDVEVAADAPVHYWHLRDATLGTAAAAIGTNGSHLNTSKLIANANGGIVAANGGGYLTTDASGAATQTGVDTNVTTQWSAFAVEGIFRARSTQPDGAVATLVSKRKYFVDTVAEFPFNLYYDGTTRKLKVDLSKGDDFAVDASMTSAQAVTAETWVWFCVNVRNSGDCEIWQGRIGTDSAPQLVASTTISFALSTHTNTWKIGTTTDSGFSAGATNFSGDITRVALYSAIPTETRLRAHYAAIRTG